MKKRTKKILFTIIGIVLSIALIVGTYMVIDLSDGNVSGSIYVNNLTEGTGDNEWRRYDVDISYNHSYSDCLYTNEPGDYIKTIGISYDSYCINITYRTWFWFTDDLQTVFVLSNMKQGSQESHYVTPVETTHWGFSDKVSISYKDICPNFFYNGSFRTSDFDEVKDFHIIEIWVRTEL